MQSKIEMFLQWIDDFLHHAASEEELLQSIGKFFSGCKEHGLNINPNKCRLFLKKDRFCGRIISMEGVQYDPRNFEALVNMKKPHTAADLQQLMTTANWMRNSLPNVSAEVEPLKKLLEGVYKYVGNRTKRAIRNVMLNGLWDDKHDVAFESLKNSWPLLQFCNFRNRTTPCVCSPTLQIITGRLL